MPETKGSPHYGALNGLRAIAVLLVLAVHTIPSVCPWGWVGVQIFFVLSGFLITGILIDSRSAENRYQAFYARRALRIFPLYYGVLFLALLCSHNGTRPPHFWLWFVYLQNIAWFLPSMKHFSDAVRTKQGFAFGAVGHFWSLAVEEQFYLIWPFLVFSIKPRLKELCYVLIGLRLLLSIILWRFFPVLTHEAIVYRMLPTQWDGFLLGALLAIQLRVGGRRPRLPNVKNPDALALGSVAGYALLMTCLYFTGRGAAIYDYSTGFQSVIGLPLLNGVSLAILVAVLTPGSLCYRVCRWPPLMAIGQVSYGFYVYHLFIVVLTTGFIARLTSHLSNLGQCFWLFAVPGLLTYAVAYLSFRYFEEPILRLKRHFVAETPRVLVQR